MTDHALSPELNGPAADPALWLLDKKTVFLNHGSFGSCPRAVLEFQQDFRYRLERQPIRFLVRELEALLDQTRVELAEFVGADPMNIVPVPNATAGVNTVLRSLRFSAGDELLVTNHEYNACRNALNFVAERWQARVVVAAVPFPVESTEQIVAAILEHVTPRTRLLLVDHVTSQTGLVMPVPQITRAMARAGIDVLIDGAHAPGMLPLNLSELNAAYYTGNCHKWMCAPKGAGFLCVRPDRQQAIRPLSISHGANSPRQDRSRFHIEFGWTGTLDPSAFLAVSEAIRFMGSLLPGGWPAVMEHNRRLALAARDVLCRALRVTPPCPAEMIGSLVSLPLADAAEAPPAKSPLYLDPLQDALGEQFAIEVPIIPWPAPRNRILRISAQLYNSLPQYETLANALRVLGVGAA